MLPLGHKYRELVALLEASNISLLDHAILPTQVGRHWDRELMVMGRATNGYSAALTKAEAIVAAHWREAARQLEQRSERGEEDPMRWVSENYGAGTEYRTSKSAFWRVVRSVGLELGLPGASTTHWSSHLAWGNLYRVAPASRGNPSAKLRTIQFALCAEQMHVDLSHLQPRRLLILAGANWAEHFLRDWTKVGENPSALAQCWGRLAVGGGASVEVVVARHPQGKPEAQFVSEVTTAFEAMAQCA